MRALAFLGLLALACSGGESPTVGGVPPVPQPTILISGPASVPERSAAQYTATVLDPDGHPLPEAVVEWGTSFAQRGVIDGAGLLTTRKAGILGVQASFEGVRAEMLVSVQVVPLLSIVLTSEADSIGVGDIIGMRAIMTDVMGRDVVPDSGLTWDYNPATTVLTPGESNLGDPRTATLGGLTPGLSVVSARYFGIRSNNQPVLVLGGAVDRIDLVSSVSLPAGRDTLVHATARDGQGRQLPYQELRWASSRPDLVTVERGRIRALQVGEAVVSASADGVSASAVVRVLPPVPVGLEIEPAQLTLQAGSSSQTLGTVRGSDGTALNVPITWATTNPVSVGVSSSGLVSALFPGFGRVVATAAGFADTLAVTVLPRAVTLTLAVDSLPLFKGDYQRVLAAVRDSVGRTLDYPVEWSVVDGDSAVHVDESGGIRARDLGQGIVEARHQELSVRLPVRVDPRPIVAIAASRDSLSLIVGRGSRVVPYRVDDLGYRTPVEGRLNWTIDDPTVATVDTLGWFLGKDWGVTRAQIEVDGLSDTILVVVDRLQPVGRVEIDTDPMNLAAGLNALATARLFDRFGQPLQNNASVYPNYWELADSTLGDVSAGRVTPRAPGSTWLRLRVDAATDSVPVLIHANAVDSVRILPLGPVFPTDTTIQLSYEVFRAGSSQPETSAVPWLRTGDPLTAVLDTATHTLSTLSRGEFEVSAYYAGRRGTRRYTVEGRAQIFRFVADSLDLGLPGQNGNSRSVHLTVGDSEGRVIRQRVPTLWTRDSTVAVPAGYANGDVTVRGISAGGTWLYAEMDSKRDSVWIRVLAPGGSPYANPTPFPQNQEAGKLAPEGTAPARSPDPPFVAGSEPLTPDGQPDDEQVPAAPPMETRGSDRRNRPDGRARGLLRVRRSRSPARRDSGHRRTHGRSADLRHDPAHGAGVQRTRESGSDR